MMEKKTSKTLSIILLILSIIPLNFPLYHKSFWIILHLIGVSFYILAAILFLIGSIKSKSKFINSGFGFGTISWTLLIISSVYGIYLSRILNLEESFLIILISIIWEYYIFMPWTGKIREISHFYSILNYYGSIFHIILSSCGFLFGIIIFFGTISKYPDLGKQDTLTEVQLKFSKPITRTTSDIPQSYKNSHLNDEVRTPPESIICPICNQKNPSDSRFCTFCSSKFLICLICKRPISSEDEAFCPFCSAPYHRIEFLEWLKVKAYCINCKRRLDMWEFQKFLKKSENIEDNSFL